MADSDSMAVPVLQGPKALFHPMEKNHPAPAVWSEPGPNPNVPRTIAVHDLILSYCEQCDLQWLAPEDCAPEGDEVHPHHVARLDNMATPQRIFAVFPNGRYTLWGRPKVDACFHPCNDHTIYRPVSRYSRSADAINPTAHPGIDLLHIEAVAFALESTCNRIVAELAPESGSGSGSRPGSPVTKLLVITQSAEVVHFMTEQLPTTYWCYSRDKFVNLEGGAVPHGLVMREILFSVEKLARAGVQVLWHHHPELPRDRPGQHTTDIRWVGDVVRLRQAGYPLPEGVSLPPNVAPWMPPEPNTFKMYSVAEMLRAEFR